MQQGRTDTGRMGLLVGLMMVAAVGLGTTLVGGGPGVWSARQPPPPPQVATGQLGQVTRGQIVEDGSIWDDDETGPALVLTTTVAAPPKPGGSGRGGDGGDQIELDPVLLAVGDIGGCGWTADEATSLLLDRQRGLVISMGDNVYNSGTAQEFSNCYDPAWGRHAWRSRPSPGNHDYYTTGAVPYYNYFGAAAGPAGVGYYSYNLGGWHILSLNSNVPAGVGSAQEQWVRADLAANPTACALAYWHHPVFSSGPHGNGAEMPAIFQALYDYHVDVVLSGHDHDYERFARQNPAGVADPTRGIREFVVGTGGAPLYGFVTVRPNSEVRNSTTWGVLKLSLQPTGYEWKFLPIAGQTFAESGTETCVP